MFPPPRRRKENKNARQTGESHASPSYSGASTAIHEEEEEQEQSSPFPSFFDSVLKNWQLFLKVYSAVEVDAPEQFVHLMNQLHEVGIQPAQFVNHQDKEFFRLALERANKRVLPLVVQLMSLNDLVQEINYILVDIRPEELTSAVLEVFQLFFSWLKKQIVDLDPIVSVCIERPPLLPLLRFLFVDSTLQKSFSTFSNSQNSLSLLGRAVTQDNVEALRLLLQAGVRDDQNSRLDTLRMAIERNSVDMVNLILEYSSTGTRTSLNRQIPEVLAQIMEEDPRVEDLLGDSEYGGDDVNGDDMMSREMIVCLLNTIVSNIQQGSDQLYSKLFLWMSMYCNVEYIARVDWLRHRLAQLPHPYCSTLFIVSLKTKCIALAQLLLETNRYLDIHFYSDMALVVAIKNDQLDMASYLLSQNIPPIRKEHKFLLACDYGSVSMMQVFLQHGVNVQTDQVWRGRGLVLACANHHPTDTLEKVRLLLDHGIDVHTENDLALYTACLAGNLPVVELLVERGANINIIVHTNEIYTPLFAAIKTINPEIVAFLLGRNVDPLPFFTFKQQIVFELIDKCFYDPEVFARKRSDILAMFSLFLNQWLPEWLSADELADYLNQSGRNSDVLFSFVLEQFNNQDRPIRAEEFLQRSVEKNHAYAVEEIIKVTNANFIHENTLPDAMATFIEQVEEDEDVSVKILSLLVEAGADVHVDNDKLIKIATAKRKKEIVSYLLEQNLFTPESILPIAQALPLLVELYASQFPAYRAGRWRRTFMTIDNVNAKSTHKVFFVGQSRWILTNKRVGFLTSWDEDFPDDYKVNTNGMAARKPALFSNVFGSEAEFEDATGVGDVYVALLIKQKLPLHAETERRSIPTSTPDHHRMVVLVRINEFGNFIFDSLVFLKVLPPSHLPCGKLACVGQWLAVTLESHAEKFPINPFAIVNAAGINDGIPDAVLWDAPIYGNLYWKRTATMVPLPNGLVKSENKFAFFALESFPEARQTVCIETSLPYSISLFRNEETNRVQARVQVIPNAPRHSAIPSNAAAFGTVVFLPRLGYAFEERQHQLRAGLFTYQDDAMAEAIQLWRVSLLAERVEEQNTQNVLGFLFPPPTTEHRVGMQVNLENLLLDKDKDEYAINNLTGEEYAIGHTLLRSLFPEQPLSNWSRGAMRVYRGWRYSVKRAPWSLSVQDASVSVYRFRDTPQPKSVLLVPEPSVPEHLLPDFEDDLERYVERILSLVGRPRMEE